MSTLVTSSIEKQQNGSSLQPTQLQRDSEINESLFQMFNLNKYNPIDPWDADAIKDSIDNLLDLLEDAQKVATDPEKFHAIFREAIPSFTNIQIETTNHNQSKTSLSALTILLTNMNKFGKQMHDVTGKFPKLVGHLNKTKNPDDVTESMKTAFANREIDVYGPKDNDVSDKVVGLKERYEKVCKQYNELVSKIETQVSSYKANTYVSNLSTEDLFLTIHRYKKEIDKAIADDQSITMEGQEPKVYNVTFATNVVKEHQKPEIENKVAIFKHLESEKEDFDAKYNTMMDSFDKVKKLYEIKMGIKKPETETPKTTQQVTPTTTVPVKTQTNIKQQPTKTDTTQPTKKSSWYKK